MIRRRAGRVGKPGARQGPVEGENLNQTKAAQQREAVASTTLPRRLEAARLTRNQVGNTVGQSNREKGTRQALEEEP